MNIPELGALQSSPSLTAKPGKHARVDSVDKKPDTRTGRVIRPDVASIGSVTADDDDSSDSGKLKGPAHGVARLLAAGHFEGRTEAKLLAKFGHLIARDDEPIVNNGGGSVIDPISAEAVTANLISTPPVLPEPEPTSLTGGITAGPINYQIGIDLIA